MNKRIFTVEDIKEFLVKIGYEGWTGRYKNYNYVGMHGEKYPLLSLEDLNNRKKFALQMDKRGPNTEAMFLDSESWGYFERLTYVLTVFINNHSFFISTDVVNKTRYGYDYDDLWQKLMFKNHPQEMARHMIDFYKNSIGKIDNEKHEIKVEQIQYNNKVDLKLAELDKSGNEYANKIIELGEKYKIDVYTLENKSLEEEK